MSTSLTLTKEERKVTIASGDIAYLSPIGEEEAARMTERYGREMSGFQTAVYLGAEKSPMLVRESVAEIAALGLKLVNAGYEHFTPAENIRSAVELTDADRDRLAADGGKLSRTFRSQVETVSGRAFWSPATATQIIERKIKAIGAAPAADQA